MTDERVEGAVLVVRRTEIAQPMVRLLRDVLFQGLGQPRFADTGLGGDQHDPSIAGFGLVPTAQQELDLFVTPDERYAARAQSLEATRYDAFA